MAKQALHDKLLSVLRSSPSGKGDYIYFQPPTNTSMDYPCIVYNYVNDDDKFADNVRYLSSKRYNVTIIDEDPDSKIPDVLKNMFIHCETGRVFAVDGLYHYTHTLYYSGPRIKEEKENE